jgi:hypothetical protein
MANLKRGFKRIVWFLSISLTIVAEILIFTDEDLSPTIYKDAEAEAFIEFLDLLYFGKSAVNFDLLTYDEWKAEEEISKGSKKAPETRKGTLSVYKYEKSLFVNYLNSSEKIKSFRKKIETIADDIYLADTEKRRSNIRRALNSVGIDEIKSAFPNIEENQFIDRYSLNDSTTYSPVKAFDNIDSLLQYEKHFPYNDVIKIAGIGLIPFFAIWMIWFFINWVAIRFVSWVINGFRD